MKSAFFGIFKTRSKSFGSEYAERGAVYSVSDGQKLSDSFAEWLRNSFCDTKKLYSAREWEDLLQPPRPFNAQELKVVEAIPLFEVRKVGVSEEGNVVVRIRNNSPIELPILTIGVRLGSKGSGGYALPTKGIGPGQERIVEVPIYKGVIPAEHVELFSKPGPEPEDRPYFAELNAIRL